MTAINLFCFAHQPERLRPYERRGATALTPETLHATLFDEEMNATIFRKVARTCYFPATHMFLELIEQHREQSSPFRVSFGLSGTFLDQAERFEPELIALFQRLAATGFVEFTGETYYHSLASLWDDQRAEFQRQATLHRERIKALFGREPTVFRNTECLYNDGIGDTVQHMGFEGIMTEGVDWVLEGWRSPDYLYRTPNGLPMLLRNYRYSDDIAYRFPNASWEHFPLTAEKFAGWLMAETGDLINLMIDYEAIGEHIWEDRGIFDFVRQLPAQLTQSHQLAFTTPTGAVRSLKPRGTLSVGPFATISWADLERDTSAWLRNEMQLFCFEEIRRMEDLILRTEDPEFIRCWSLLQTSDHLYYLSDKSLSDGDVHTYFSAYGNLFESFVRLQTAITDLRQAAIYYLSTAPAEQQKAQRRRTTSLPPSASSDTAPPTSNLAVLTPQAGRAQVSDTVDEPGEAGGDVEQNAGQSPRVEPRQTPTDVSPEV